MARHRDRVTVEIVRVALAVVVYIDSDILCKLGELVDRPFSVADNLIEIGENRPFSACSHRSRTPCRRTFYREDRTIPPDACPQTQGRGRFGLSGRGFAVDRPRAAARNPGHENRRQKN